MAEVCKEAAKLTELAYAQYACFKNGTPWQLPEGYTQLTALWASALSLVGKHPFGFICKTDTHLYIIFRGTHSLEDWIANAKHDQATQLYGKVHKGWMQLYTQMATLINTVVAQNKGLPIVVAGHSLGGALATLCAFGLYAYHPTAITFASPRVGDVQFCETYNTQVPDTVRWVNIDDIVPTLPLPAGKHIYSHVAGLKTFIKNTGSITDNHHMALYAGAV